MRLGPRLPAALLALCALALALLLSTPLLGWWRAANFLIALSAPVPVASRASPAKVLDRDVLEEHLTLPGSSGPIPARLYLPTNANGRGIVVAHGVHYRGIDERRLVRFARELARSGLLVLTPELSELADYRITLHGVSVIRDAVRFLSARQGDALQPRVGLLGFSFAGGLGLVAATDTETAKRLSFVTSVGGHHDLARVLRFLIHDRVETPQGIRKMRAHDYGLLVLVYANLERFVPAADFAIVHQALKAWLQERRTQALSLASRRTTLEAERLWLLVEGEKLRELGPQLETILLEQQSELAALSPRGHLRAFRVPVYLLHGAADTVIPPSELDWARLELGAGAHQALVSPLLDHVEVSGEAELADRIALVRFMAHIL
jgi:pimeloyl-ACP methyl ester carboxylesterase